MKAVILIFYLCLGLVFATVADGDRAIVDGDYERAVSEYAAAYQQRSSNVEALYKLAKAETYLAETLIGDAAEALYEQAAEHARTAVAADPNEPEAHFELARALGRLAQFKGVVQSLELAGDVKDALEETINLNPEHGGAYHALALWHLEVPWIAGGRAGQIRPLFEQAIAAEPNELTHVVGYGKALLALDDAEAAKLQLGRSLELSPKSARDEKDLEEARALLSGL